MRAFDVCGTLRRIRRLADLSQRQLAAELLVSKSSIAAVESGDRGIDVSLLARAAGLAGLRLALIGEDGQEVAPMADDAVRDLSRRWFPAHLDTRRSDEDGWLYEPRRDRPETRFTFTRDRDGRDARRRADGTPEDHHEFRADDSPADRAEARRREYLRSRAQERERRFLAGEFADVAEPFTCTCPAACDDLDDRSGRPVHDEDCPCCCDLC